jgi:hypothetical protein
VLAELLNMLGCYFFSPFSSGFGALDLLSLEPVLNKLLVFMALFKAEKLNPLYDLGAAGLDYPSGTFGSYIFLF